jgi:hypothetical protein
LKDRRTAEGSATRTITMKKMSKLTVTLMALVCAAGLASGCKDKAKDGESAAAPVAAQKVADDKAAKAESAGTVGSGSGSGSGSTAAPTAMAAPAAGGMPTECNDYKAAVDKVASCDKLDAAARDALKNAYTQLSAGFASLPAEAKANLAGTCKTALEKVNAAAKTICGW